MEETEEEKERREFEERAAVERALKIMEVLSDAKIFLSAFRSTILSATKSKIFLV